MQRKQGKGGNGHPGGCSSEHRMNWLRWKCPAQPALATSVSPHCSVPGTGTNCIWDSSANTGTEKLQRSLLQLLLPHFLLGPRRKWGKTLAAHSRSSLGLKAQQQPWAEHGSSGCYWEGKEAGASKPKVVLCVHGEEGARPQHTWLLSTCSCFVRFEESCSDC